VEYEDVPQAAPYFVKPEGMSIASKSMFEIPPGDYLVAVSVGWGSQSPGYAKNEVVTLRFETKKGLRSPVYGGTSGSAEVTEYTLTAPEGQEIIGFFGARGGDQNLILRLGIHLAAAHLSTEQTDPGIRKIVELEQKLAAQAQKLAHLEAEVKKCSDCGRKIAMLADAIINLQGKLEEHEAALTKLSTQLKI
jgi:hypothetical protein